MGDNPESTPPEPNLKHFVFYWDKLLPACTAPIVDSWGKETRYYTKLSPKNKAITAPDEAFCLCLCIDNYWARWEKIFELKGANPPGCKVKRTGEEEGVLLAKIWGFVNFRMAKPHNEVVNFGRIHIEPSIYAIWKVLCSVMQEGCC
jgi:hypothetical protein